MHKLKHKSFWIIVLFSLSLISGFYTATIPESKSDVSIIEIPSIQADDYIEEHVNIWFSADGYYDSHYSIMGENLEFSDFDLSYIELIQPN